MIFILSLVAVIVFFFLPTHSKDRYYKFMIFVSLLPTLRVRYLVVIIILNSDHFKYYTNLTSTIIVEWRNQINRLFVAYKSIAA